MRARLPTAWLAALLLLACALSFVTAARAQGTRPINAVTELFIEDPITHVRMGIGSNTVITDSFDITPQITIGYTDPPEHKLFFALIATACNLDPNVAEQLQITLRASPSGFTQRLVGTETTTNSGLFRIRPLTGSTSTLQASPASAQSVQPGDTLTISYAGCGNVNVNSLMLTNRGGVVYDAVTKTPVAGARVKLIDTAGTGNGGSPGQSASVYSYDTVTPAPNEFVTGADGRYFFQLTVPSTYRLSVTPPARYAFPSAVAPGPAGTAYTATAGASYGGDFVIGGEDQHISVDYDIPLDPHAPALTGSLSTQIAVSTPSAEIADSVEYVITVRNTGQLDFPNVELDASLPFGFAYLPGSARLEGGYTLPPPTGVPGPSPVFQLGSMAVGESRLVHLRARLTAGAPRGDGVARAQARAAQPVAASSNVASVKVKVDPGVFSDQAIVLGTVFADCNANGVQDPGEPGAPGVRLYLEDGTSVVTDGAGRYSFYGLSPRTHVLKIDATSLPDGAEPVAISQRHAGDGASRFVDVQRAELHRADFALRGCSEALTKALRERRAAQADRELGTALKTELKPGAPTALGDLRALPAQGVVGETAAPAGATPVAPLSATPAKPGSPIPTPAPTSAPTPAPTPAPTTSTPPTPATVTPPGAAPPAAPNLPEPPPERPASAPAVVDLETLAANADNQLGFVDLKEGDVVGGMPRSVRIKGRLGATIALQVNGVALGADRIGRTVRSDEKQSEWHEYIGVTLRPGDNVLVLTESDPFGHVRGNQSVHVTVPGALARLVVTPAVAHADADGKSTVAVRVEAFDAAGLRITDRLSVTLQTSAGQWNERDLDLREPGVQTVIEGDAARLELQAPAAPGDARLSVSAGAVKGEARVEFGPVLRPMLAVGIVEGALNLRRLSAGSVQPANSSDGFEQELHQYAGGANGGAAARAALFLKGKVRGDYLLTLGYDSDKSTQQGLFRDIQPDAFYPVYGDSSVRGFDAQSTGKLYVRVEKDKSYLLYGDFTTQSINPARQLGAYQRSLSGVKEHYEAGAAQVNAFASRDSSVQTIDEIRADGTSGPFLLRSAGLVQNSEKVEILVRDRNQPALIVKTTPLERFTDYDIDALTGRLLLRAPVPSLDPDLNPESIRITYEVDQGGPKFWVAGVDGQVAVTDFLELGGSYVTDRNPLDPFRLESVNSTVKFDDKTQLIAEEARAAKELEGSGAAQRVELKHEGPGLKARVYATRSDVGFDNPSATIGKGRSEGGAKVDYALDERTRLVGEALHTGDRSTGSRRDGVLLGVERSFDGGTKVELGARRVRDDAAIQGQAKTDTTSLRAKVTASVPGVAGATAFVEAEQDVHDTAKRLLAVGGDYRLGNGGKLYLRHELISSLSGPYALDATQRRNSTLIGVDSEYMQDGRVFSEYRGREAFDGRETEAAIGLKNRWTLAEGLRLNTSFERVQTLSAPAADTTDGTANAVTGAIEYTANPLWKGTARLELRDGQTSRSVLSTFGIAAKLSADWTFLGKNAYALTQPKNAPAATTATTQQPTHVQERLQLGAAYRDSETNRVNGLMRYEFKQERGSTLGDTGSRGVHIVSAHADYQPQRELTLTGHVAAKLVHESIDGAPTRSTAELVGGRATWELARDWDVGASANLLATSGLRSRQSSVGGEVGYQAQKNLWVSAGYNVTGFKDRDLSAENYTSRGVYLRVRFKFDENLFASK